MNLEFKKTAKVLGYSLNKWTLSFDTEPPKQGCQGAASIGRRRFDEAVGENKMLITSHSFLLVGL